MKNLSKMFWTIALVLIIVLIGVLGFGYYKNATTSSGSDTFTINSIKIGDEEYISGIIKTDSEGKANIYLKVGTYDISEIEAPTGYDLNSNTNTITKIKNEMQ